MHKRKRSMRNPSCWLFGCVVTIDWEGGSRYSPSRDKWVPCPINYCARCGARDGDPANTTTIGNMVDRRNLYRRTIPIWLMKWRNGKFFREHNHIPPTFTDRLRSRFKWLPN